MTRSQEDAAYYAVITAPVRYDPELSSTAKLLYAEITSLCRKKGYCWSGNSYFAELYGLSEGTVSRLISQLERRGHIRTAMAATATGSERRIYTDVGRSPEGGAQKPQDPQGGAQKPQGGVHKNAGRGVHKKRKQNDYQVNDNREVPPYSPPTGDGAPPEDIQKDTAADKPAPEPKPRRSRARKAVPTHAPERFEQFWAFYPAPSGSRLKAVAEWDELAPDDGLIDEMARALKRQKASPQWREGIGIPHACRWLRDRRWTDKLPDPAPDSGGLRWADDPEH